jgi:hypothetical protein
MRKIKFRGIYVAVLAGAIVGAAVGIPAWAASGGGDSGGKGSADNLAPAPPPRGAFGLQMKGFPSAAEMRRAREQLDELASCMREHGADIPGVKTSRHGVSISVPRPQASDVMRKAAKECGMPPPPSPHELFPLSRKQIEKNRRAITRGDCPPLPPALPGRK